MPKAASADSGPARSANDSLAAVEAANPDQRILLVTRDEEAQPGLLAAYVAPKADTGFEHAKLVNVEANSARLLPGRGSGQDTHGHLLELHAQWFMGPLGEVFGALIALLVLDLARVGCRDLRPVCEEHCLRHPA